MNITCDLILSGVEGCNLSSKYLKTFASFLSCIKSNTYFCKEDVNIYKRKPSFFGNTLYIN